MNKFKDNSTTIQIPSFDGLGTIEIKVKRPQLMAMMTQGKIPNRLLGIASQATMGGGFQYKSKDDIEKLRN